MDREERFEKLYKKLVDENASELEKQKENAFKERKRNVKMVIAFLVIFIICSGIIIKALNIQDGDMQEIIILYLILAAIFIALPLMRNSAMEEYEDNFKNKIMKALMQSFNETLEYKPKDGISSTIYDEALFERHNVYKSTELITGTINENCKMNMAEVYTRYDKEIGSRGGITKTSFYGIFSKIETPKTFNTELYIRKDKKSKNFLEKSESKLLKLDKLKAQLDSTEFEEIFDIYASDKIVAMQLLTTDIMEMMVEFYNKMNMYFEITIKENFLYIRFYSGNNFEIVPLNEFSLDKKAIYENYRILYFVFELTNKLIKAIDETPYI